MNKINEIFTSWRISFDPTVPQAELASERIQICEVCEHKETVEIVNIDIFTRCNLCGCALKAKIFTPKTYLDEGGSCPIMNWADLEEQYLKKKKND